MAKKIKTISAKVGLIISLLPSAAAAQFSAPVSTNLPQASIVSIISNIMYYLLSILGILAVIGFVISGILYLIAAGDEKAQERAKRAMVYSITGVIVGLIGLVVLYAVNNLLSASTTI